MKVTGEAVSASVEAGSEKRPLLQRKVARRALGILSAAASFSAFTSVVSGDHQPFPYEPGTKVAIVGDSLAAGNGEGPFEEGTNVQGHEGNRCRRSDNSAGQQLADRYGLVVDNLACSGSTTDQTMTTGRYYEASQIDRISDDTQVVLYSSGGNDLGNLSVMLEECVSEGCPPEGELVRSIEETLGSEAFKATLQRAYLSILIDNPERDLYITQYPNLIPEDSLCDTAATAVVGQDTTNLVQTLVPRLNEVIQEAAEEVRLQGYSAHIVPAPDMDICSFLPPYYVTDFEDKQGFAHPARIGYTKMSEAIAQAMIDVHHQDELKE